MLSIRHGSIPTAQEQGEEGEAARQEVICADDQAHTENTDKTNVSSMALDRSHAAECFIQGGNMVAR